MKRQSYRGSDQLRSLAAQDRVALRLSQRFFLPMTQGESLVSGPFCEIGSTSPPATLVSKLPIGAASHAGSRRQPCGFVPQFLLSPSPSPSQPSPQPKPPLLVASRLFKRHPAP